MQLKQEESEHVRVFKEGLSFRNTLNVKNMIEEEEQIEEEESKSGDMINKETSRKSSNKDKIKDQ